MSMWYENKFRRTLLDMHIEDWDDSFLSKFSPEEYFDALKTADVNAVMIYVQSHVGLCYWPTKTGVMHRAYIGDEGKTKRLFELCKSAGMSVILYYSIIYNNREYERHPEWRLIDANGRGSRDNGSRYGLCCPNNMEYLTFVKQQIAEFSEYFEYDGVFFDMTFWPGACYCPSCRKRWQDEVGGEMPRTVDWNDKKFLRFVEKQHEWLGEFANTITKEAKKCKPGISVEHQYSASMHYWRYGNNENIAKASDYIGTDLYGGIRQQSFACKAWYNLTQNQPFQYMTSRCYPSLSEHTTTRTKDQLRQCVGMTYVHHGAAFLIDAVDPVGTINKDVYKLIGEAYREAEPCEVYFKDGKMKYDVALYYDLNGKMNVDVNGLDILDARLAFGAKNGGDMPHQEALIGACNALRNSHIPFGVINNWKKDEMYNHKVLVLPDIPMMKAPDMDMVLDYVKQGGNLYFSGHTAPRILKEVFGLLWLGYTEETITYMSPTSQSSPLHNYFSEKYPLTMNERAVVTEGEANGRVLATLTLPYTIPTILSKDDTDEKTVLGRSENRFATIHANPPGKETDIPALVETCYGKGRVVWSAIPIERADRYQHNKVFCGILKDLIGEKLSFGAVAPESVECVLFEDIKNNRKILGVVDTREAFEIPAVTGCEFWVESNICPQKVYDVLSNEEIPFKYNGNKVYFNPKYIDVWTMFCIEI